ncbi:MAG: periplasmic binding protein/LacI transcriptional regulator [Herbinix sp.]|jgi:ribose transport system substrate-binding protein|nr:periplasmic binding protein/LacI transcriptional regulator [Herbinix sp.]
MNKRKTIATLIVVLMALTLFFIWYNFKEKVAVSTTTTSNKDLIVYLITMDKMDQHWYSINQGAADMADLLGITYIWDAPETKDVTKQVEILNKAVNEGADVIMLAVTDPIMISSAVEDAKARGVKIIYVDSPAYEEVVITLATDNYSAGVSAGETMIAELAEFGINSGSIGIVGVNTVTDSTIKRENGFREAIESDGRFTLLGTEYGNGDPVASEELAANFINNNMDLVGLFGTNEGSTVGVGNAIKANNPKIIGIGFDKSGAILNLIREGSLKASLAQNPYTMGYLGMAEAFAAWKDYDTGPPEINTGVSVLRR